MKIGVLCAIERELKPYLENVCFEYHEKHAMSNYHIGHLHGHEIVAVYSGVCKVNGAIASQVLIQHFGVDAIIISGTAGSMQNQVKIFDSVISTEVAYHDVHPEILTGYHPWMKTAFFQADPQLMVVAEELITSNIMEQQVHIGKMATGEYFVDQEGREEIIDQLNPLCVDMETAGMAHVCHVFEKPFIAVRSISDAEDESGEDVFAENCDKAAFNSYRVVNEIIRRL